MLPFLNTLKKTQLDFLKRKISRCLKTLFNLSPFFSTIELYIFLDLKNIEDLIKEHNIRFVNDVLNNKQELFISGVKLNQAINRRTGAINLSATGHLCEFWLNCIMEFNTKTEFDRWNA
jgi:hypothetical protein